MQATTGVCFTVQNHVLGNKFVVVIFELVQLQMWYNGYYHVAFGGGWEKVFIIFLFLKKAKVWMRMVFREQICHGIIIPQRQAGCWGPG